MRTPLGSRTAYVASSPVNLPRSPPHDEEALAATVLDEPLLPSPQDIDRRWWKEPKSSHRHKVPSPLVDFRTLSRSTSQLVRPSTAEAPPLVRPLTPGSMSRMTSARAGSAATLLRSGQRRTPSGQRPLTAGGRDPSTTSHGNVPHVLAQLSRPSTAGGAGGVGSMGALGGAGGVGGAGSEPADAFARDPGGASNYLRSKWRVEDLDTSSRLAHWLSAFENDETSFASKAVFVEMRLRQALASSVMLGAPNHFRCSIVCDAFERVAPLTGRYEGVLGIMWQELIRCIYSDWSPDLLGSGARSYAERRPYFVEYRRLSERVDEQKRTMLDMGKQREEERVEAEERKKKEGQYLGVWNRAVGSAAATLTAEELRAQVEELERQLKEASAELSALKAVDPVAKAVAAFEACDDAQQEEVLSLCVLKSDAVASLMVGNTPEVVGEYVSHMLSKLPDEGDDEGEATLKRVMQYLVTAGELFAPEEKAAMIVDAAKSMGDMAMLGNTLGEALMSKVPRHKEVITGLAKALRASPDPDYRPDPNDSKAVVAFDVLRELRHGVSVEGAAEVAREEAAALGMAYPGFDGRRSPLLAAGAGLDAAAKEAAAAEARIADLKKRQEEGNLTDEEKAELEKLETRLSELHETLANDPRIPPGGSVGPGGVILDASGKPLLGDDGLPIVAGAGIGPGGVDLKATEREAEAAKARIDELKKRQEAGELSDEEMKELNQLESKLAVLEEVMSGGLDPAKAAAEAEKARERVEELKRRQEAGELSAEEKAELEKLEGRLTVLEGVAAAGKAARGGNPAAEAEAREAKARIDELKRKKEAGELSPAEEAEMRKLESKLAVLEEVMSGGLDPAKAAEEAKALKKRKKELEKRKKAGKLTAEEKAELEKLEGRLTVLEDVAKPGGGKYAAPGSGGGDGAGGSGGRRKNVPTADKECQAGPSMIMSMGGGGGGGFGSSGPRRNLPLPDRAMTTLGEIKFNRKDVKAMNVLMCRKLIATLYQVRAEANKIDDAEKRPRTPFPDYVPNQFVVLYGVKSLALKSINEFFYGVRAARFRQTADGRQEDEPLVYFFWRATHHGVPLEERLPAAELAFYMDLLSATAKAVSEEHTLNCKGGAFWNHLGTMQEMHLPVFLLLNVVTHCYGDKNSPQYHTELGERIKRMVLKKAQEVLKLSKDPKTAPKPNPPYKTLFLGKAELDSRGFLSLDAFLQLAMQGAAEQRVKDAKVLDAIFAQWTKAAGEETFDVFAEMMMASSPDLPEEGLIRLYQMATSGDDPDKVQMGIIDPELRKMGITIKRKSGASSLDDGVATMEDIKAVVKTESIAASLFGVKRPTETVASGEDGASGPKTAPPKIGGGSRWTKVRAASRVANWGKGLLKELEAMREGFESSGS